MVSLTLCGLDNYSDSELNVMLVYGGRNLPEYLSQRLTLKPMQKVIHPLDRIMDYVLKRSVECYNGVHKNSLPDYVVAVHKACKLRNLTNGGCRHAHSIFRPLYTSPGFGYITVGTEGKSRDDERKKR